MAAQIEPGVWYVIKEAAPAKTFEEVVRGADTAGSSDSSSAAASLLREKSTALREVVEPAVRSLFDLLRQYHVHPSALTCRVCGCAFEGHVLSADHFLRLSGKLEAHAHEASPRDAFWQEIRAPGSYVIRFNHVDFEVQLCFGEPPPPHIPPKPGAELQGMNDVSKAGETPDSKRDCGDVSMSPFVMAAVEELIESGSWEQFCKARPNPLDARPVPVRVLEPKTSPRDEPGASIGQSPSKQLASSSTDSTGSMAGTPNDLVATEACMPQLPTMPAFMPMPSEDAEMDRAKCNLEPRLLPLILPPVKEEYVSEPDPKALQEKAASLDSKVPIVTELCTPPGTPLFPFTPPPPTLRPSIAPPPSMKMVAPAAPEMEPVGPSHAKRPVLRPPVRDTDHMHLRPGRAVVCLLDGAWWPATVQSFCPKTGMAKVFWERQDWNAHPTVVDARRLRPRAAATGPTQPLQPRISGFSRSIGTRSIGSYPQRVQPVRRPEPEVTSMNIFIAQEMEELDAALNSVRDAAKRAFEDGADGVTLRLQADCENNVDPGPVNMNMREGSLASPVLSRSHREGAKGPLYSSPSYKPADPAI